jgi:hypothetical protein
MCQKKSEGGARCASHLKSDITAAKTAFYKNPSDEAQVKITLAENAYNGTPEGIKALRAAGRYEEAERQELLRDIRTADAKRLKLVSEAERLADEAIRNKRLVLARSEENIAKLVAAGKHALAEKLEEEADNDPDVRSSDPNRRESAAWERFLGKDQQELLAKDNNFNVVHALAMNRSEHIHPDTLRTIAEDSNLTSASQIEAVRRVVAMNPRTPWDVASKYMNLVEDKEKHVIANKTVPVEVLQKLAQDERPYVSVEAQARLHAIDRTFPAPDRYTAEQRESLMDDGFGYIEPYAKKP